MFLGTSKGCHAAALCGNHRHGIRKVAARMCGTVVQFADRRIGLNLRQNQEGRFRIISLLESTQCKSVDRKSSEGPFPAHGVEECCKFCFIPSAATRAKMNFHAWARPSCASMVTWTRCLQSVKYSRRHRQVVCFFDSSYIVLSSSARTSLLAITLCMPSRPAWPRCSATHAIQ